MSNKTRQLKDLYISIKPQVKDNYWARERGQKEHKQATMNLEKYGA